MRGRLYVAVLLMPMLVSARQQGGGAGAKSGGPVPVSADVLAAACISCPQPPNPRLSDLDRMSIRSEQTVSLDIVVGKDGKVRSARSVDGHEAFQRSALDTVRTWRFSPQLVNGEPAEVRATIAVKFVFVPEISTRTVDILSQMRAASLALESQDIAIDSAGNLYIPFAQRHIVGKVSVDGSIAVVAGTGNAGFRGDGSAATAAQLDCPSAVAVDSGGNLYIADTGNHRVRVITRDGRIRTVAGTGGMGTGGDGGPATAAQVAFPNRLFIDAFDNLFIGHVGMIRRVAADGSIRTVVRLGTSTPGLGKDGSLLVSMASTKTPSFAVDPTGNFYMLDVDSARVLKITPGGLMLTVAGTGKSGDSTDGGPAVLAALFEPNALAVDRSGNVYIAEGARSRVRKVTVDGVIHTVDGDTVPTGNPAIPRLGYPRTMAVGPDGSLNIIDARTRGIRRVSPVGGITIQASALETSTSQTGNPTDPRAAVFAFSTVTPQGSRTAASAPSSILSGGALRSNSAPGDASTSEVRSDGLVHMKMYPIGPSAETRVRVAGSATPNVSLEGQIRIEDVVLRDRPAPGFVPPIGVSAPLQKVPESTVLKGVEGEIQVDFTIGLDGRATNIVIARGVDCEFDQVVIEQFRKWKFEPARQNGQLESVPASATLHLSTSAKPGKPPLATTAMKTPTGIAVDASGFLFIASSANALVRKVAPNGAISVLAGRGTAGFFGNGHIATDAELKDPTDIAVDSAGNVFITDTGNSQIRRVFRNQIVGVAGEIAGFGGDGGRAVCAQLKHPEGIGLDAAGNLYIADTGNSRIRMVTTDGTMRTIAGTGTPGFSGEGGPAALAELKTPTDVAVDAAGNIYIADTGNQRIRRIDKADGTIRTVAGTGATGFSGDQGAATAARLNIPSRIVLDSAGNLYIADSGNHRIRILSAVDGTIRTVVGDTAEGATVQLKRPVGLAIDSAGSLFITDADSDAVFKVLLNGTVIKQLGR